MSEMSITWVSGLATFGGPKKSTLDPAASKDMKLVAWQPAQIDSPGAEPQHATTTTCFLFRVKRRLLPTLFHSNI